jgi:hypothetical protein
VPCNCHRIGGVTRLHSITTFPVWKTGKTSGALYRVNVGLGSSEAALFPGTYTAVPSCVICGATGGVARPVSTMSVVAMTAGGLLEDASITACVERWGMYVFLLSSPVSVADFEAISAVPELNEPGEIRPGCDVESSEVCEGAVEAGRLRTVSREGERPRLSIASALTVVCLCVTV